jgi:hypothetical protein
MVYKKDALAVVEIETSSIIPTEFAITGAYPNPFNSATTISYSLPEAGDVTLSMFDANGRLVETLAAGFSEAGSHTLTLSADGLPSGLYLVKLGNKQGMLTQQLVLLK